MKKDTLLFNKIAASVLAASLLALALGVLSDVIYTKHEIDKNSYNINQNEEEVATAPSAPVVEAVMVSDMLAGADIVKGEKLIKKCASCHSFNEGGANKTGPNLYNIIGSDVARDDSFSYSKPMKELGGAWDYESLALFLTKPKNFIKGTKMNFAGLKKPKDRANLIAYIRTISANPVPLP